MNDMRQSFLVIIGLVLSISALFAQAVASFPGAEGGGMYTTGGRGGAVYYVNTLEDNEIGDSQTKEGSLRWCINQTEPRTILFKTGGTIYLKSNLSIKNGNLTIAGQSAPGDGICLAGFPVTLSADNVIIRFLRFRMGDRYLSAEKSDGADAFSGRQNTNVILDHCSISWSTDECSSFYDNENFTMQWCIVSESLRLSGHSKGPHGYGAIWGGLRATFHHNLLAHHDSRTPRYGPGAKYAGKDTTDVRNNVFYNWNGNGAYGGEAMHINIINNYYKPGPGTEKRVKNRVVALNASGENGYFKSILGVWGKYYISGNVLDHEPTISTDNWLGVTIQGDQTAAGIKLDKPLVVGAIHTHDAQTAYEKVLAYAGCSIYRDAIDQRIVQETATGSAQFIGKSIDNGKGGEWKSVNYPRKGIIDSQEDLNPNRKDKDWSAWPILQSGATIVDTDGDGIPDGWLERNHPGKKALDLNEEGYTYLECYLNSLIQHITINQI
jgi:hypothetical protein